MLYSQDRQQIRRLFRTAWQKHLRGQPAEPLEIQLASVISLHPEYQPLLEDENSDLDQDYLPEHGQTNPFLHMGMHISLREQLATDRPSGITGIYKQILIKTGDEHHSEHLMMDCLGESLYQAQINGHFPDENLYLQCLKRIINSI